MVQTIIISTSILKYDEFINLNREQYSCTNIAAKGSSSGTSVVPNKFDLNLTSFSHSEAFLGTSTENVKVGREGK